MVITSVKLPLSYPLVLSLNFTSGAVTSDVLEISATGSVQVKLNDFWAVCSVLSDSLAVRLIT